MEVYLTLFLTAFFLLVLDSLYLTVNKKFLESQLHSIQGKSMQLKVPGMVACYVIIILGLYYFILRQKRGILDAFLLGFFVYGVYETTNYATLNHWKADMVVMDTLWGGILFASTTFLVNAAWDFIM